MSSNRALVQNAWRGCRSGDEAHSLADVFDPDVVAEAASLQLAGKLFFAGEGPNDAYVLHLKNKATGQKRGRAAESGQGGGRVRGRGHGRWRRASQVRRPQRRKETMQAGSPTPAARVTATATSTAAAAVAASPAAAGRVWRRCRARPASARRPCRADWLDWDCNCSIVAQSSHEKI